MNHPERVMLMVDKTTAFEYLITSILSWKSRLLCRPLSSVGLSRTQSLKLLFLASTYTDKDGSDLLDVFDNYYAMQFGPVESDVLNSIMAKELTHLETDGSYLKVLTTSFDNLDSGLKSRIDNAVQSLIGNNPNLIRYSASQLIDVTHKWWCWKQAYHNAQILGKGSYVMSIESIRKSNRVFGL